VYQIGTLAPVPNVGFFPGGISVREVRRTHERILPQMPQQIIKILIPLTVHECLPGTKKFLRITVVLKV
jgi:hypothetical protein